MSPDTRYYSIMVARTASWLISANGCVHNPLEKQSAAAERLSDAGGGGDGRVCVVFL